MFRLHKEMSRLDIPAQRVLRLERSLSDVQVAMPGLPAQEATAYLCGFVAGRGFRVAVVLHLHSSSLLAFYLNDDGEVSKRDGTRVYNQALGFAESMGFMFGDLDIHLKSLPERETLWKSVPLQSGVTAVPAQPAKAEPVKAEPVKAEPVKAEPVKAEPVKAEPVKAEPVKAEPVKAEPVKAEPVKAEPVKAEPVKAEPVKAEPVKAEPVKAEPVKAEPVKAEPVKAEPVKAEPVKAEPAKVIPPAPGKKPPVPVAPVIPTAPVAEFSPPKEPAAAAVKEPGGLAPSAPVATPVQVPIPAGKGPGKVAPRPPDATELALRRKKLRENLGRFLASL